jgi:NTP pyrophosphatase (non-canonical NTP hydrolase)
MNFIEYSPLALRTAKPLPHKELVQHALLGLVTEVGELADCVKKHAIYGKDLDKVNMMEEVSDLLWYLNLYMVEKGIGGRVVDAAVDAAVTITDKDKPLVGAELTEAVLLLAAITGSLTVEAADRGSSDSDVVVVVSSILGAFLVGAGYTLSQALRHNINKLVLRYGDKYSDYKALNRDTVAERVVLEGK